MSRCEHPWEARESIDVNHGDAVAAVEVYCTACDRYLWTVDTEPDGTPLAWRRKQRPGQRLTPSRMIAPWGDVA